MNLTLDILRYARTKNEVSRSRLSNYSARTGQTDRQTIGQRRRNVLLQAAFAGGNKEPSGLSIDRKKKAQTCLYLNPHGRVESRWSSIC